MSDRPSPGEWNRILLEAAVLLSLGVLLGLSLNYRLVSNVLSGRIAAPTSAPAPSGEESLLPEPVTLEQVRELLAAGALAVDARDAEAYAETHLPGAVSLPLIDFEGQSSVFFEQVPRSTTLVVYCSGYGCPDSFDLSVLLLEAGYRDVRLFEGGLPEWSDAGLALEGDGQ